MPRVRTSISAATVVLALSVAACGSSSKGLSQAQLATKVNAACRSYNSAEAAVPQPADFSSNPAAAATYLDKIKVLVHTEVGTIDKLTPASSVKSKFEAYRAAADHQSGFVDRADATAHAKKPGALAIAQYQTATLAPLARGLGFTACAS